MINDNKTLTQIERTCDIKRNRRDVKTIQKTGTTQKVLIIDHELGVRRSLNLILKQQYSVIANDSLREGLLNIPVFEPDVVILDVRPKDGSAIEGLKSIRDQNRYVSVIMLTGYGTVDTAKEAIKLGADDYIIKPFATKEIIDIVERNAVRARRRRDRETRMIELNDANQLLSEELAGKEHFAKLGLASAEYAHDLAAPLTGMIGYVSVLRSFLDDSKEELGENFDTAIKYLATIEREAHRCYELSRSWIALSNSGHRKPERIYLDTLLRELINSKWPEYPDGVSSPEINYLAADKNCMIIGDRLQLYRALNNVLDNSLQSVPKANGAVRIVAEKSCGNVKIKIADNGPGMAPETLAHIFDPYYTTKFDTTKKGTGLGLFITDKIIREHCGSIKVASELGSGTETTITLPLPTPLG